MNLQAYKERYQQAIKDAQPGDVVMRESVWIYLQWLVDNETKPGDEGYEDNLLLVKLVDIKLFEVLIEGSVLVDAQLNNQ